MQPTANAAKQIRGVEWSEEIGDISTLEND